MKLKVILVAAFFLTVLTNNCFAQKQTETYTNARFEYTISYPSDLLKPQGEPDNHDGQVFKSDDGAAEMRVYGGYNALEQTLSQIYQAAINETGEKNVSYKLLRSNFFVVSGKKGDKIYYRKTILNKDELITFLIEYDAAQKSVYDSVTAKIAGSLKSKKTVK